MKIPKSRNPKAIGLFLESYGRRYLMNRKQKDLEQVAALFQWLTASALHGYSGPCWGYHFDWPNRGFFARKGTPTIVNTAFIGLSLLVAEHALQEAELDKEFRTGNQSPDTHPSHPALSVARASCDFILRDLHTFRETDDEICFSYTPEDRRFVHNASLMGAWLLAAVFQRAGEAQLAKAALAATRFTVRRQRPDGSWPYGLDARDQWADNFHTGFVLVALREIGRSLNTDEFSDAALRGYQFWKEQLLEEGYIPKYYPHQKYPIDIHCVAQAIITLLEYSDVDPGAADAAARLCRWAIDEMQDPQGFFHYQVHRYYRVRIPYMRWGQAWMHLALTRFAEREHDTSLTSQQLSYEFS